MLNKMLLEEKMNALIPLWEEKQGMHPIQSSRCVQVMLALCTYAMAMSNQGKTLDEAHLFFVQTLQASNIATLELSQGLFFLRDFSERVMIPALVESGGAARADQVRQFVDRMIERFGEIHA